MKNYKLFKIDTPEKSFCLYLFKQIIYKKLLSYINIFGALNLNKMDPTILF